MYVERVGGYMYMYIYIYIHTYTYTYIYIYTTNMCHTTNKCIYSLNNVYVEGSSILIH